MKREDFLNKIGFPADLEAEAVRIDAEAQALWDTIRYDYFTKAGKEKKKQPAPWSEPWQVRQKVNKLRSKATDLRWTKARLERVHNDPWSHIRSEELREYGFEAEALVVDAARERNRAHNDNARFIAEAENLDGRWSSQENIA